jgi:PAS domain S-box-containing protein
MADGFIVPALDRAAADAGAEALLAAPPPFADLLPVALFACDGKGRIAWCNAKAAEIWGRAPEPGGRIERHSAARRIASLDGGLVADEETPTAFALRTGEPVSGALQTIERADGIRRTVTVHVAPLRDAAGGVAGALTCFGEVDDADPGAQAGAQAGDASEGRLHDILNALPVAIYTTDADGRITFCNDAAAELSGRRPALGQDEWCVTWKLYAPDGTFLPHDQCPMAVAVREDRPVRGVEAVAERPDGSRVPFAPYPTPIHDSSGRLVGAVNMLIDLSGARDAEDEHRRMFAELNHRIRNNVQMLHALLAAGMREAASPDARSALGDAAGRVASMATAQSLLYRENRLSRFDGAEFVESVCAAARRTMPGFVTLACRADPFELGNDCAVPLALILNELLANAARHGAGAQGLVEIRVSLHAEDGRYVLTVEDQGPGFELTDIRRRASGLGLVAGLARQLGGGFIVRKGRGGGACCIVRFRDEPRED